jgi:predicted nucleic acid-binding protein
MYYIDTNILIYVNDTESPYHHSASEIFYNLLEQKKIILHEIVLTEFFSIITDSRKMESPWSTSQARDIKRYDIYDHLLAYSMKFYGIDKIVTLNKADFERYDFIKEIISPSS